MKKNLFYACLFLVACHKDDPKPMVNIPAEFKPYIDRFLAEGKKRNQIIDLSEKGFKIEFADLTSIRAAGLANQNTMTIQIDNQYWGHTEELEKEKLIFHEMGHLVLLRQQHTLRTLTNGEVKSIMWSNEGLQILKYPFYRSIRRDYYIDELFDPTVPEPEWASKNPTIKILKDSQKTLIQTAIFSKDSWQAVVDRYRMANFTTSNSILKIDSKTEQNLQLSLIDFFSILKDNTKFQELQNFEFKIKFKRISTAGVLTFYASIDRTQPNYNMYDMPDELIRISSIGVFNHSFIAFRPNEANEIGFRVIDKEIVMSVNGQVVFLDELSTKPALVEWVLRFGIFEALQLEISEASLYKINL